MKRYEFMVLVAPDVDVEDAKKREDLLKKLIGSEAKLKEASVWRGKRQLAYSVDGVSDGSYLLATVEGKVIVSDIEKRMKLGTEVIRYLLTVS